jgi:hypothetical protein
MSKQSERCSEHSLDLGYEIRTVQGNRLDLGQKAFVRVVVRPPGLTINKTKCQSCMGKQSEGFGEAQYVPARTPRFYSRSKSEQPGETGKTKWMRWVKQSVSVVLGDVWT